MQAIFRPVTIDDIPALVGLTNECFSENTSIEKAEQLFRAQVDDQDSIYLAGFLENQLVAFARIAIVRTPFDGMGTYAILNHVCVKPEFRRHHLGTALLSTAEDLCRDSGCSSIKLWSKNFRVPAHALYQKFGFHIINAKFFEKELT